MYWNTVNFRLKDTLDKLMTANELSDFRLVGGTALSLQLGHRMSDDIDLFTDISYGSVDFEIIENYLIKNFPYVSGDMGAHPGMGKTYLIGQDVEDYVKLDIYYSMDPFFQPYIVEENVRMATIEEVIAMKVDIVQRGGRKKDFWDLHELMDSYTIENMIALHAARFQWTHEEPEIRSQLTSFSYADEFPDPKCLRGKEWEFIKQDFIEMLERSRPGPDFSR
ncbi:MAG: nucleotidyl transferase AbiEii/AbiGii toxin family protein [Bacteroidota bacterium]